MQQVDTTNAAKASTVATPNAAGLWDLLNKLQTEQILEVVQYAQRLAETGISKHKYHTYNELSKRESEVLLLIANGYTRREIGTCLGISPNTASRHIANIYRKLDISSVAEATQYALQFTNLKIY